MIVLTLEAYASSSEINPQRQFQYELHGLRDRQRLSNLMRGAMGVLAVSGKVLKVYD
jgi:hypothetical protein